MTIEIKFISRWDGNTEINSNAELDLETGKIENIETVDIDGLCVLSNESISVKLGDMTAVFEVVDDDDGDPAVDPDDLKQIRCAFTSEFVENRFTKAKKAYKKALLKYKSFKRKQLLDTILRTFEKEAKKSEEVKILLESIKNFNPKEVYLQRDIFLYDGYRIWCESFVFVNKDNREKAIITAKDADFDSDSISIYATDENEKCFEGACGVKVEGLEDWLYFLQNLNYDEDIVEIEEKTR